MCVVLLPSLSTRPWYARPWSTTRRGSSLSAYVFCRRFIRCEVLKYVLPLFRKSTFFLHGQDASLAAQLRFTMYRSFHVLEHLQTDLLAGGHSHTHGRRSGRLEWAGSCPRL